MTVQQDTASRLRDARAAQSPDAAAPASTGPAVETERPTTVRGLLRRTAAGLLGQLAFKSLFINLLSLAAPVFALQVYDRVIPHNGYETLKGLLIVVLGVVVFDFILKQARSRLVQMAALRIDVELSRRLFARLTGLPLAKVEAMSDADWRMLLRDAETVRDTLAGPMTVLLIDLPFAALFIGVIALIAPPLALTLALLAPVFLALAAISSLAVARATRREHEASQTQHRLLGEVVAGRATVKALGLGEHLRQRWERGQADSIRSAVVRGGRVDAFNNLSSGLALTASIMLTTVGAVAIMGLEMTLGGLVAANMLSSRVIQPFTQLISLWRGMARFRDAERRLDETLALPCERVAADVAHPRPKGGLKLEKAVFSYPGAAAPTIDTVTAAFRPGAMTGIVGANGCGKSTLLKLLQGLYTPESGRVLIDGADIAQFGRRELSRWIGYAPQEPFLFAGSIRDNIAKGRDDIDDGALLRAAQWSAADGFILDLPDGFGAEVGEGGRRLSPGQRQRLALARALVDDPAILLLDEPSAHLDLTAEAALRERLTELKRDRSIVVVSHSRPLLEACDTIIVMHNGRIAMAGRSAEVLPRQLQAPPPRALPRAEPAPEPEDAEATTTDREPREAQT